MSSASPQVIEYLTRQLGRNPINESGDIVRTRAKAFRLEAKQVSPQRSGPTAEQRQQVRDQLEQIRQTCFTGDVGQLLGRIRQLPVREFPELAALASRLKVVLESRGKLPALAGDPRFDGDFFSVLKKILVSPSRDVAVLREQVLASFRHRRNRRRGQGMIRLLKTEMPDLYALEADWLDSLLRYSARKHAVTSPTAQTVADEGSGSSRWPGWVLAFLTIVLIKGCVQLAKDGGSSSSSRSKSSYSAPRSTAPQIDVSDLINGQDESFRSPPRSVPERYRTGVRNDGTSQIESAFERNRDAFERARAQREEIDERHRARRERYTQPEYARPPNMPAPSIPRGPSGSIQPSFAPSATGR